MRLRMKRKTNEHIDQMIITFDDLILMKSIQERGTLQNDYSGQSGKDIYQE